MELRGRAAIVTGGAGGLGAATVRRLVALGAGVAVFDRDEQRGAAVKAAQSVGTLSVVVNVAGGATGAGRTVGRDRTPLDMGIFRSTLDMNAVGTFNVTRLAAVAMADNDPDEHGQRGVVVNTASIAGLEGQTGQVAYAAAKAAIIGMTLPMARDLAPLGIRVCAIAPGTMGTPLMMSAPEELRADLERNIVFPKRMGRPEEFAQLVESIVANPYLNGETIRLDGALRFPPK
jgi:NAD(P)-dependent dehydrogenase (short-subunit alcohol dehydrogenase family)